ncbi:MAG: hypothetical protein IPL49_21600 [Saprospirales bacterium]|nr:hypothetical protein [Saprospirales bacterium]
MKTLKWVILSLALVTVATTWYSCKDEEIATCDDGIMNGDETGIDCGGTCAPCPTCNDGIQNGDEEGVDCGGPDCPACYVALQDTRWQSSGANVAPLLVALFQTDSIYAEFGGDFTYKVEQFDALGAKTELTGTYSQAASSVTGIWTIVLNQTTPTAITAEGIFQITGNEMKYEIVQTNPPAGTPPTPEAGFGSTNAGALGTINVQTYVKL